MRPPKTALIRIGREIRDARARSGLSQAVLAEKAGIPHDVLSRVERGEGQAPMSTLAALARVVGPIASFVEEPSTPPDLAQAHLWTDA
ncbi:helix-turn-helix domain-containing protein [Corynebacterium mastitidis]|uniref:helix-turn-helix domain-containing protein n=1 Tax=Corynebacterium mastitidis TaxID=161890 RepID=UPI0012FEE6AC|nr:helix-turn-helix transcriptional regulator [Corynebacterium mastitidis]MCH6197392.1 helix-turn-helix domain-containing protein [Corynebacterium mastitidis]